MKLIIILTCLFSSLMTSANTEKESSPLTFFEIRTYHANEGKLEELHKRFREHTCALFKKHQITNIVYLEPTDKGSNSMTYLLGYQSREQRDERWEAFRKDEVWIKAFAESKKNGKLVKTIESSFYNLTDYSPKFPLGKSSTDEKPQLFEIRTYTTKTGKLANLDARFRDHTCKLFTKHGMRNVIYMHPVEGAEGHGTTLTYIISHKDMEARNASFKAFSKDPAWQAARNASEEAGKILIEKGVVKTFYTPSDYSPLK